MTLLVENFKECLPNTLAKNSVAHKFDNLRPGAQISSRNSRQKIKLQSLAQEYAKDRKTSGDLSAFSTDLTVETTLNAELDEHLDNSAHEPKGCISGNSRNSYTP